MKRKVYELHRVNRRRGDNAGLSKHRVAKQRQRTRPPRYIFGGRNCISLDRHAAMDKAIVDIGFILGIGGVVWLCVDLTFYFIKKASEINF
jgi:hypothetical protein